MEQTKNYAEKSLELLISQNETINNIDYKNKKIENTLSYSKYIIDSFNCFIKKIISSNSITKKETPIHNISSIISINKTINKLIENQNKTLSEINKTTQNNNNMVKQINSHPLF
jgi:hypothetical protein